MDILLFFFVMLGTAGSTFGIMGTIVAISDNNKFKKATLKLNQSQFGSAIQSFTPASPALQVESTKPSVEQFKPLVVKPLELTTTNLSAVTKTTGNSHVVPEYLIGNGLPPKLKDKAVAVSKLLVEAQNDDLSIENSHDLEVIADQLNSSVLLFKRLPAKHQTTVLIGELLQQWDTLEDAVQKIVDVRVQADVAALKAGSSFVASRFRKGLELK